MDNFEKMQEFSNIIFDRVKFNNLEYIDAIVSYCEEVQLEIESIIPLISPSLKSKMEEEALSLRLIKSNSHRFTF